MKILIAEDQPHLSRLLNDQVRPWGYEPVVVHDGLTALSALQAADAPRLALLDWLMPGLDGIEVCRCVRQDPDSVHPYLVLLTGQGGRQQMLDGLEAGADDFLSKPVDDAELKARLAAGRRVVALQEQLREMAHRDALTGLRNRAAVLGALNRELTRGRREGRPVGVVLADVDHFKRINDTFGHLAGDAVLRQAARCMQDVLRPYDTLGRYGGEEFLAVLPGCDVGATAGLAERLRQCVAEEPMGAEGALVPVTISLGAAAWVDAKAADADGLLRAADVALYQAKAGGRNRVTLAM
jgi:two-component system, cell cycle response regulator